MRFKANFFKLNEDFSQEHADLHFAGKESANNRRFEWEDELEIKNEVDEVITEKEGIYFLTGYRDGEEFKEPVSDMRIVEIKGKDNSVTMMAFSEKLIEKCDLEQGDFYHLKVLFKDSEPLSNPVPGIYIALQDFPKSLID
ncbi:MAG: hypothetical protein R3277_04895 [Brumimicrobium sp.]|nr:hypothetical protein [Brumimicrobium sp.]